jgi:hypothetical protein
MIGPDGLEQSGNITRCDRVARFAFSVFAGVTEVRDDGGNTFGRRIAQSAQEKEQAAELVVHALLGIAMQRLNDKSVLPSYAHQRPSLMLTVFEFPFFVRAKCCLQMGADFFSEVATRIQCKHCNRV